MAVIVVSQSWALLLILVAAPLLAERPAPVEFGWGAAAGVAYGVGLHLLYHGLSVGRMSVVAPVTGVCALVVPVSFSALRGESIGAVALIGILFAVVAIVLISQEPDSTGSANDSDAESFVVRVNRHRVIGVALTSGAGFGLFFIALSQTDPSSGLWPLVATRSITVLGFTGIALFTRQSLHMPKAPLRIALAGGTLDICANSLYLLAVQGGVLSLAATLTSLYPATTVLLAALVLRERLRGVHLWGLLCAALAVVLISV